MRVQKTPRYQGKITSWKDDQGFGFIAPNGGGPPIFVHIKSFADRAKRPASDAIVTFELTTNEKGQPRAEKVEFVGAQSHRASSHMATRAPIAAAGFLGAIGAAAMAGRLPPLVFGLYLGMSAVAFFAYAIDKSAARNQRFRTRESTLHVLGLIGGWPGALLAQQLLRHKSRKESFRVTFWWTVALNCGGLGWLLTPSGSAALQVFRSL